MTGNFHNMSFLSKEVEKQLSASIPFETAFWRVVKADAIVSRSPVSGNLSCCGADCVLLTVARRGCACERKQVNIQVVYHWHSVFGYYQTT